MTTKEWAEQEQEATEALNLMLGEPAKDFKAETNALWATCTSLDRVQMVCMTLAVALIRLRKVQPRSNRGEKSREDKNPESENTLNSGRTL